MRLPPIQVVPLWTFLVSITLLASAAMDSGFAQTTLVPACSDARLNDVCFIDTLRGWAVGDRGTVLHTEDGGKTWRVRISDVNCPLRSVWFLDAKIGWAAGGASEPYTHRGRGVLLRTENGGRSWTPSPYPLPPLRKVRFVDAKNGWALGDASAMHPSGLFLSDSSGLAWKPAPGPQGPGWLTADMLDPHTGALAGRGGTTAAVRLGSVTPTDMPSLGPRNLTQLILVPPVFGWLIGDEGLLMMTGDAGQTWGMTPGPLPEDAAEFDFRAISVRGTHCWVAGDPGTRVFHSPDAGRTWEVFSTDHTAPLRGLCFVDEKSGWAVGDFGTILRTEDGGRTWQRLGSGGTRAALLGIFSGPSRVPLELLAQLCAEEGYLGVVETLTSGEEGAKTADHTSAEDRLHEAVVGAGGTASAVATRFPVLDDAARMDAERIVQRWNAANDGRAMELLQARLVRRIRTWRPSVVITHDASPRGDYPFDHLINQAVLAAIHAAADPTAFATQITQGGLKPWRVDKVYAALRDGATGTYELSGAQIALRLGRPLADVADDYRGLIANRYEPPADTLHFRLILNQLPHEPTKPDPFNGIILHPGGDARRAIGEPAAESLHAVHEAARRRRNMQAILSRAEEDEKANLQLLGNVKGLLEGMDAKGAGHALYQLGRRYARTGHPEMAAETFEMLFAQSPDHPLAAAAVTWLVQYYASGEAQWRAAREQTMSSAAGATLAIDASRQEDRLAKAAEWGKRLERTQPQMLVRPEIGFPLAAADRRRGFPKQAERFYLGRRHQATRDAWWAAAEGEAWLLEPKGLPPKPVLHCARADSRPTLDGSLDEPFWKNAKEAVLAPEDGQEDAHKGTVRLAYDAKFLYLAVECERPQGRPATPIPESPRPRDGDLSGYDRVSLYFDLDRDYATHCRFTVDERGWTGESCFDDPTWNPDWFVAAKSRESHWVVEAAIPLDSLTAHPPSPNEVWAAGIQRIIPNTGLQSWTRPAAVDVLPEGFGYLMFQ